MKNPQKENGYTAIANEIMDQLARVSLSGNEWKILMYVFRKTYGFNKKQDRIPLSQFVDGCDMDRTNVCRTIKKLVAKRILVKTYGVYGFNKGYNDWVVVKSPVVKSTTGSGQIDNLVVANSPHSKVNTKVDISKVDIDTKKEILLEEKKEPTPDEVMHEAISEYEHWQETGILTGHLSAIHDRLVNERGHPEQIVLHELKKFMLYWTEPTRNGKKQQWQTKTTFELYRRLATWFDNANNRFNQRLTREEQNLQNAHLFK